MRKKSKIYGILFFQKLTQNAHSCDNRLDEWRDVNKKTYWSDFALLNLRCRTLKLGKQMSNHTDLNNDIWRLLYPLISHRVNSELKNPYSTHPLTYNLDSQKQAIIDRD